MTEVRAYEVNVTGTDWRRIINATRPGQAKVEYYRDLADSWPSIPFTALRARCVGMAVTSAEFTRVATYRGFPDVRCGDEVSVGTYRGVIVGHNSSANFDVLMADGPYRGQRINVHPAGLQLTCCEAVGTP